VIPSLALTRRLGGSPNWKDWTLRIEGIVEQHGRDVLKTISIKGYNPVILVLIEAPFNPASKRPKAKSAPDKPAFERAEACWSTFHSGVGLDFCLPHRNPRA